MSRSTQPSSSPSCDHADPVRTRTGHRSRRAPRRRRPWAPPPGPPRLDVAHLDQGQPLQPAFGPDELAARSRWPARAGSPRAGRTARACRPTLRMAMRSASLIASSMSWVTNTIVLLSRSLDVEELVLQPGSHDRVDRGERLVHEHHRRVGGQGAGHAHPLALAARELGRVPVAATRGRGRRSRPARRSARAIRSSSQPSSLRHGGDVLGGSSGAASARCSGST